MERKDPSFNSPIDSTWSSCGAGSGRIAQARSCRDLEHGRDVPRADPMRTSLAISLLGSITAFENCTGRTAFAAGLAAWQARRASPH